MIEQNTINCLNDDSRVTIRDKKNNQTLYVPVSTNIPIELTASPETPTQHKTQTEPEENFSSIQAQINLLKDEIGKSQTANTDFQNYIKSTLQQNLDRERDYQDILIEKITILETENKCLKNEIQNQKQIIEVLLSDEKVERNAWKSVTSKTTHLNDRNISAPVNLQNRFHDLGESVNNTNDIGQITTPTNAHRDIQPENQKSKRRLSKRNVASENQRRPDVCITEKYIQNQVEIRTPKIVPGNRTYASTTKYGKKIMVVGDSHIKRIKRNLFNDSFDNAKSYIKSFSGAKIDDMKYYITPSLKEQKPDIAILHVGGNDITHKNKENINIDEIARNIVNIAIQCKEEGVSDVIISEVLPKRNRHVTAVIRRVNDRLAELCKENNFHFISHHLDITTELLCHDGIHLTDEGTTIFAGNMVDYINNFILNNRNIVNLNTENSF